MNMNVCVCVYHDAAVTGIEVVSILRITAAAAAADDYFLA